MGIEEKILREKEFHNETFSTNSRSSAKKYYKSASYGKEFYSNKVLENVTGKKVLIYGCGPGGIATDLAKEGAIVSAIDISEVAIQQILDVAHNENVDITALVMNAEDLTFKDDSFDLICGSGILHHF